MILNLSRVWISCRRDSLLRTCLAIASTMTKWTCGIKKKRGNKPVTRAVIIIIIIVIKKHKYGMEKRHLYIYILPKPYKLGKFKWGKNLKFDSSAGTAWSGIVLITLLAYSLPSVYSVSSATSSWHGTKLCWKGHVTATGSGLAIVSNDTEISSLPL